jgi:hypothetical protein
MFIAISSIAFRVRLGLRSVVGPLFFVRLLWRGDCRHERQLFLGAAAILY